MSDCDTCGDGLTYEDNTFGAEGPAGPTTYGEVDAFCTNPDCPECEDHTLIRCENCGEWVTEEGGETCEEGYRYCDMDCMETDKEQG